MSKAKTRGKIASALPLIKTISYHHFGLHSPYLHQIKVMGKDQLLGTEYHQGRETLNLPCRSVRKLLPRMRECAASLFRFHSILSLKMNNNLFSERTSDTCNGVSGSNIVIGKVEPKKQYMYNAGRERRHEHKKCLRLR
jgi:hypothetical protein